MNLDERARMHQALGDPTRLRLVDDLARSDRSPSELMRSHGIESNLLAHHLGVLEGAGIVERIVSSGDRRRRYVTLRPETLSVAGISLPAPEGPVLFVCTHNSARSQLAAALWEHEIGTPASSAGTHPSSEVHAQAIEAAEQAGLDLSGARPKYLDEIDFEPSVVVTVCDRAHEELSPDDTWWHWSTPDPVGDPDPQAFERALERLRARVASLKRENPR